MLEELWFVVNVSLVFLFGLVLILKLQKTLELGVVRALCVYIWHTLFCFAYFFYVEKYGGDANVYFEIAVSGDINFKPGTAAVYTFTTFLVQVLNLSKLGCFLVFNIFGSIGLMAVDASLKKATENKSKYIKLLAIIIVFLPSVSFWSSAIGKDSVSFMAMGLALWASLQLNQRMKLMIFAVLIMFLVRPHMAGMMIIALSFALVLDKNIKFIKRFFLVLCGLTFAAALVPFALNYAGITDFSNPSAIIDYIEKRQTYNMEGGGGVDISSMSLPMQLFTYMFRPVIFEVNSITTFAAALDNTVLLFLFAVGFIFAIKHKRKIYTDNSVFLWIYSLIAWLVLATTTANLGISLRQKWMFAPMLVYLLISLIGKDKRVTNLSVHNLKHKKLILSHPDTQESKASNTQ